MAKVIISPYSYDGFFVAVDQRSTYGTAVLTTLDINTRVRRQMIFEDMVATVQMQTNLSAENGFCNALIVQEVDQTTVQAHVINFLDETVTSTPPLDIISNLVFQHTVILSGNQRWLTFDHPLSTTPKSHLIVDLQNGIVHDFSDSISLSNLPSWAGDTVVFNQWTGAGYSLEILDMQTQEQRQLTELSGATALERIDLSADNRYLMMVTSNITGRLEEWRHNLYVMEIASGEVRLVISDIVLSNEYAKLSPDGQEIAAFITNPDRSIDLVSISLDGNISPIIENIDMPQYQVVDTFLDWSSDERYITLSHVQRNAQLLDRENIFIVDKSTGEIIHELPGVWPLWSPSGTRFVPRRLFQTMPYYVTDLDDNTVYQLDNPGWVWTNTSRIINWLPDSERIALAWQDDVGERPVTRIYRLGDEQLEYLSTFDITGNDLRVCY